MAKKLVKLITTVLKCVLVVLRRRHIGILDIGVNPGSE